MNSLFLTPVAVAPYRINSVKALSQPETAPLDETEMVLRNPVIQLEQERT